MKKESQKVNPVHVHAKQLSDGHYSIDLSINVEKKHKCDFRIEIHNEMPSFAKPPATPNITLIDFLLYIARKDRKKTARQTDMYALIHHLQRFDSKGIPLCKVNKEYILGFTEYLKTARQQHPRKEKNISDNTQAHYYRRLNYVLNYAVIDELIPANPMNKILKEDKPRPRKREREYLNIDEIKALAKTEFYNTLLKQAFLFSCFCGLRHCDIVALCWKNFYKDKSGKMCLKIIQQKTKEYISLPLSDEALKHLPSRKDAADDARVFDKLISLGRSNEILSRWAQDAGINKHITFHVARHTYATLLISLGADIYTVSKLLGHTNIQTTQIYAKILDESKKKAIDLIPNIT